MTYYKKEIINIIAKNNGVSKKQARKMLEAVTQAIVEGINQADTVKIANFFNFFKKEVKEKKCKNPYNGEPMVIPPTPTIYVKMTKYVKDSLRNK